MTGRSTKQVLRPNEMGEIEIVVDTRKFRGARIYHFYLLWVENGKLIETEFTVTAVSIEEPEP